MYCPKNYFSSLVLILLIPILFILHLKIGKWQEPEKLINFDTKSYYSYFPAAIIEGDLRLDFLDESDYPYRSFYYANTRTADGDRIILTSCGMAIMYSPFSFIAYIITSFTSFEQSGFSIPYAIALVYSNMFYLLLGLFFLRKLLLRYFNDYVVGLSISGIFFGTNMLYYSVVEMTMPHVYVFSLSAIFLYFVDLYYSKPKYWISIIIGVISGLIVLIRPNNIVILILLIFWGVFSLNDFYLRIRFVLKHWIKYLLMAIFFIFIWTPQFYYWYLITGKVFYFSYSVKGGGFYFENPQILNQLFSYRSGVLMYSPLILFGYIGLVMINKKVRISRPSLILYLLFSYYIISSWWSWWNGGSFGIRSYIDSYIAVVIGFAVFLDWVLRFNLKVKIPILFIFIFLTLYGSFRTWQYNKGIIHYDTNTKNMYFKSLFATKHVSGFWEDVSQHRPDYFLGRCGLNASELIEYDSSTRENQLINEIRRIKKDKALLNQCFEEAKIKRQNPYKYIRKVAEKNIDIK